MRCIDLFVWLRVNFYRIQPCNGVCSSSDVLRTLNEEATKTKAEKEQENRKWTTFLQKPNRPIPKSKLQIEAEERAANATVKIVKSVPKQDPSKDERNLTATEGELHDKSAANIEDIKDIDDREERQQLHGMTVVF